MDEQLIRDGFLDKYKALVFCWGNVIEADVLAKIDAWMRSGGTVLYPSFPRGALETVEGDSAVFARWSKGDTGAGGFRRFQGDMEPYDLYGEFVRKQLQEMNSLDVLTKKALEIKHTPQVFMSVGENGDLMILNYEDVPQILHINSDQTVEVPSYGIERLAPEKW